MLASIKGVGGEGSFLEVCCPCGKRVEVNLFFTLNFLLVNTGPVHLWPLGRVTIFPLNNPYS